MHRHTHHQTRLRATCSAAFGTHEPGSAPHWQVHRLAPPIAIGTRISTVCWHAALPLALAVAFLLAPLGGPAASLLPHRWLTADSSLAPQWHTTGTYITGAHIGLIAGTWRWLIAGSSLARRWRIGHRRRWRIGHRLLIACAHIACFPEERLCGNDRMGCERCCLQRLPTCEQSIAGRE